MLRIAPPKFMKIFTWTTGILGLLLAGVGVWFQYRGSNGSAAQTTVLPVIPASVGPPQASPGLSIVTPTATPAATPTTPTPKPPKNPRKDRYSPTAVSMRNNL